MKLSQNISNHFKESIEVKQQAMALLPDSTAEAVQLLINSLINDGKILVCGNGGSAADAQHFAAELVGRFEKERMGLPAIALTTDTSILTAIGNDYDYDLIFSRQVKALGKSADVLFAISTSGNSVNVIEAIHAAHEKGMSIIALTGKDGGKIVEILETNDILLNIPYHRTARIQEVHILLIHAICDCIDILLFGEDS